MLRALRPDIRAHPDGGPSASGTMKPLETSTARSVCMGTVASTTGGGKLKQRSHAPTLAIVASSGPRNPRAFHANQNDGECSHGGRHRKVCPTRLARGRMGNAGETHAQGIDVAAKISCGNVDRRGVQASTATLASNACNRQQKPVYQCECSPLHAQTMPTMGGPTRLIGRMRRYTSKPTSKFKASPEDVSKAARTANTQRQHHNLAHKGPRSTSSQTGYE